jgi:hypothetical protein
MPYKTEAPHSCDRRTIAGRIGSVRHSLSRAGSLPVFLYVGAWCTREELLAWTDAWRALPGGNLAWLHTGAVLRVVATRDIVR